LVGLKAVVVYEKKDYWLVSLLVGKLVVKKVVLTVWMMAELMVGMKVVEKAAY
jgi:hypothetical protein